MATDKDIHLVFHGRPKVQKNDNVIRYKYAKGRRIPFVGHSEKLTEVRDAMSVEFYRQYKEQGFTDPIDYLFEANMVFYCTRQSEPDYDNLPAIVLDALQGVKIKKTKTRVAVTLTDDKLGRLGTTHKIVKGDPAYDGEPRTEVTIRRYELPDGDRTPSPAPQGSRKNRPKRTAKKV